MPASRSAAYARWAPTRASGSTSPCAARTPPAASRREIAATSAGSTSQYRVGIGRPPRVNGALRTTTGAPESSRATTSKSVSGTRPRRSVTAARSTEAVICCPSLRSGGPVRGQRGRGRGGGRVRGRGGEDQERDLPGLDEPVLLACDLHDGAVLRERLRSRLELRAL